MAGTWRRRPRAWRRRRSRARQRAPTPRRRMRALARLRAPARRLLRRRTQGQCRACGASLMRCARAWPSSASCWDPWSAMLRRRASKVATCSRGYEVFSRSASGRHFSGETGSAAAHAAPCSRAGAQLHAPGALSKLLDHKCLLLVEQYLTLSPSDCAADGAIMTVASWYNRARQCCAACSYQYLLYSSIKNLMSC